MKYINVAKFKYMSKIYLNIYRRMYVVMLYYKLEDHFLEIQDMFIF